jgi:prevent-host-death family protein
MDETVSAAEANRSFSRLLKGVQSGRRYIVTSHGTPVAQIIPASSATSDRGRAAAKKALLERLARQSSVKAERWTRDELYEDGP